MTPATSLKKMFRLLFFRTSRDEILNLNRSDLIIGVVFTWLVGVGRYWDDPGAKVLQHLGLGSVMYILVLSGFLWLLFKPFRIESWSYQNVLTYVSLTAFPAILYAIPVERFLDINTAASINAYFLLIVAAWRVALLVSYLKKFARLTGFQTVVAALLPLTVIIASITALNLERAVFEIMGGIRERTSNDSAYMILNLLTMLSVILFAPLLISYGVIVYKKWKQPKHLA
ncbi:MAG: hypothetical protein A2Z20_08985 [Bdellovibrionales bacterium RBG_16_40_8]|nr:MAG: hypothetical protein A2Z20_08985 [Bdellovibrionales bacterium RBG_16_40_8]